MQLELFTCWNLSKIFYHDKYIIYRSKYTKALIVESKDDCV